MKPKILYLLLAALLLLSACSSQSPSPSASSSAPPSTEPSTQASTEPAAPESSTPPPVSEVPALPDDFSLRISALKGPTAMGLVNLMDDTENDERYAFTIFGAADEATAALQNDTVDIAAIPCNLAAMLYQKLDQKLEVLAVNTLGVLYLVDTTGTIQSIADLKGKTIYSTGMNTTPEFALNYILSGNGLVPGTDVTIEYKSEASEVGALLAADELEICVLPEPYVTTVLGKNEKAKIALSLTEEWNKLTTEHSLLTGCVVVRKEYLAANPEVVADFMTKYEQSIAFINANVDAGAASVAKYDIAPEAVAKVAIPRCNLVFLAGSEMKEKLLGYLGVLFTANPASVGGTLPDDGFFYGAN
jgi:NitT/TauT family transport system substrate-binding protein